MTLEENLKKEVAEIFRTPWTKRDGNVVPESDDIGLGNDAVTLDATVLYADMADSTQLVNSFKPHFAAEIYKSFLHCAAKIIHAEGADITAYDGDRIMAVFLGDTKETDAARAALKINYARHCIINPAIKNQYPNVQFELRHVVGIDTSSLYVARTGIRGSNDLVWVGRAANYAAKLSALSSDYPTRITKSVFQKLHDSLKISNGKSIWEIVTWNTMKQDIYRSTWRWKV